MSGATVARWSRSVLAASTCAACLVLAPPLFARETILAVNLKSPTGEECTITIATSRDTAEGKADLEAVNAALRRGFEGSQDMRDKIFEACRKWQGQIVINVMRDEPFESAGVEEGTNKLHIDLGDLEADDDFLNGEPKMEAGFRDIHLTSTLAHEFEHLKDGPGERNHRDPADNCSERTTGPAVDDQNQVMAELGSILVRLNYGDPGVSIKYRFGGVGMTLDLRGYLRHIRGLPPPPPPKPLPPPPPLAGTGTSGGIAVIDYRRSFPLDGIPDTACDDAGDTGCYPRPQGSDRDLDGVVDPKDNCPQTVNPQQGDRNGDGIGDACDRTMPPCSAGWSFTDPKVYGSIGGAVLGGLLIAAGGGDAPTATINTPTASPAPAPAPAPAPTPTPTPAPTPAPTPEPTPAPTPAPPPRTTADGRYRCVAVRVVNDEGRHNPTINLGPQLTGDFDVREGSNTITIRHPEPFVDIVNAQFDPATGRFSGTAVGRVAGSPNVGVRAEGTVNTTTGQIVFTYTMGTGGELPGRLPIVYEITLQKQ